MSGGPNLFSAEAVDHDVHAAPGGHLRIACFISAPDGKLPRRARHVQGVHGVGEVEREAADRRRERGVDLRLRDHRCQRLASRHTVGSRSRTTAPSLVTSRWPSTRPPTPTFDAANAYFNEYFSTGTPPAGDAPATINGGARRHCAWASGYFEVDLSNGRYARRRATRRRRSTTRLARRVHRRLNHHRFDERRARVRPGLVTLSSCQSSIWPTRSSSLAVQPAISIGGSRSSVMRAASSVNAAAGRAVGHVEHDRATGVAAARDRAARSGCAPRAARRSPRPARRRRPRRTARSAGRRARRTRSCSRPRPTTFM